MAELTERMPLTQGTNRIIEDPAPVPVLGQIADFVSGTIAGYQEYQQSRAASNAQRRKEQEEAEKKALAGDAFSAIRTAEGQTTGINYETLVDATAAPTVAPAPTAEKVFTQPGQQQGGLVSPEAEAEINKSAGTINKTATAVDQGRMPQISMTTALNIQFERLRNKYPGMEEEILDLWKKAGVDTNLFRPGRDSADELDFQREERQASIARSNEWQDEMYEKGLEGLGGLAADMTKEEVIAHGLKYTQQAFELNVAEQRGRIASSNAQISEAERKQAFEDTDIAIRNSLSTSMFVNSSPIITQLQQAAGLVGNTDIVTPTQQKQFEEFSVRVNQMGENYIQNALQIARSKGYRGDLGTLERDLRSSWKRASDLFTGELSVAKQNARSLSVMRDTLGIQVHEAMPVFMAVRQAGIEPDALMGVMEGLQQNTDLQKQLRNEIKGFTVDFGADRGSERLMNIVRILRGEATLADMRPEQARRELPNFMNINQRLTDNFVSGRSQDTESVLNSVGTITIAANTLAPSSGSAHHAIAAASLSGNTVTALAKMKGREGLDETMYNATVQAVRATHAHVLNNFQANLPKVNETSEYFQIVWDNANGRYKLDDSGKRAAIAAGPPMSQNARFAGLNLGQSMSAIKSAKPPKEMERWLKTANMSIDSVIQVGRLDPSTPKGSELELRRYYGNNQPLKSLQQEEQTDVGKEINTILGNVEQNLAAGLQATQDLALSGTLTPQSERVTFNSDGSRQALNLSGGTVTIPSVESLYEQHAENPVFNAIVDGAQEMGIPADVAVRLGFVETGGKYNDPGTNSAGASGPMQVVGRLHNELSQRLFGKDVTDLTPEENVKVGLTILKQYAEEEGGDWVQGAFRYIGTGRRNKSIPEANDGNIRSLDYATIIAGQ